MDDDEEHKRIMAYEDRLIVFSMKVNKILAESAREEKRASCHLRLVASEGEIVAKPPPLPLRMTASDETKRHDYTNLVMKAAQFGYKIGWAAYRYKEKYGEWPPVGFKNT